MTVKLVIFDLDGVLVDACEWHRVALNEALKEVCNYEISLEDHYKTFNGIPTKKKLLILTELGVLEKEDHEEVYNKKQAKILDMIKKHAKIRKEKINLIKSLKSRGLIVACFTNSIRMTAELILDKTGILDLLDYVLTNEDVSSPKPDPEGYIKTMQRYLVSPTETLIVEDSPKGKQAAYASNAHVLEVDNQDDVNEVVIIKKLIEIGA
jgi:HAD superfamily hydrolase (TIGR01509 family)